MFTSESPSTQEQVVAEAPATVFPIERWRVAVVGHIDGFCSCIRQISTSSRNLAQF